MHQSIGAQPFLLPTPVMLIGTYDAQGKPNIMTAAWGGLCASQPASLAVSVRRGRWTHKSILERKAFTVNIPSRNMVAAADFAGIVSGAKENKFELLGLDAIPGENVDAPYVAQCPLVIELTLSQTVEIGSHTQFIGEIMDVKIAESCMVNGVPDMGMIDALHFVPIIREYWSSGTFVAKAFAVGKTVVRTTAEDR